MGFTQRFNYFPGVDVLNQIEGIAIVDLGVPGSSAGVGSGVVACAGEFSDMTRAVAVDGSGVVSTSCQPIEVFSPADFLSRAGGWDETIGDFGASGGNGFAHLRSKKYGRLVLAPINLASAQGSRFFRSLPLCTTQTDANPVVPVIGTTIPAGTEFRSGSARFRVGAAVKFTALPVIVSGIGGATVSGSNATTQVFNATAGFDWTTVARPDGTVGTYKGDILVIGNNNAGAVQPTAEAGTYRVAATPTSGASVSLEKLDGSAFAFTAQSSVPWRLHVSSDADSAPIIVVGNSVPGGYGAPDNGGYSVPLRPLTKSDGTSGTDGTHTAGTVITPAVTPITMTGSSWDAQSGLGGRLHPTTATAFTAAVQKPNATVGAALEALYVTALAALEGSATPVSEIDEVICARTSANIIAAGKAHALDASKTGTKARRFIAAPNLNSVQNTTTATQDASPGVGASRDERVFFTWPGFRIFIPEAVGFKIKCADGTVTTDGMLDMPFDSVLASLVSILPPERSPDQTAAPVPDILSCVLGIQRGVPSLTMADYIRLKARGVAGLFIDPDSGPELASAVTTSLTPGQQYIDRIRFQDYCDANSAKQLKPYKSLPMSQSMIDSAFTALDDFFSGLMGDTNIEARIKSYRIDDKGGNTPELAKNDIFVFLTYVNMLSKGRKIVVVSRVGVGVDTSGTS